MHTLGESCTELTRGVQSSDGEAVKCSGRLAGRQQLGTFRPGGELWFAGLFEDVKYLIKDSERNNRYSVEVGFYIQQSVSEGGRTLSVCECVHVCFITLVQLITEIHMTYSVAHFGKSGD